jgi:hypothetical protein
MSKRSSKEDVDTAALNKLKKYINSLDQTKIEKRKSYAKDPRVKERRKELNGERRLMWNVLTKLISDGKCFDKDGNPYSIHTNRVITQANKTFYFLNDDRNLVTSTYSDDIDLVQKPYKSPGPSKKDEAFEDLLNKFIDGDPTIIEKVSKKRIYTESSDPTVQKIREKLLQQNKDSSDKESSDEE